MRQLLLGAILALSLACSSQSTQALTPRQVQSPAEAVATVDTLLTFTDMAEARAVADETGRDILLVFAGSDWCRPCKQFRISVLEDAGFRQNLREELVVLYLDFPSKRRNQLPEEVQAHHNRYAERYNAEGVFPRLYLLDAEEAVLAELKFAGEEAPAFESQLRAALASE